MPALQQGTVAPAPLGARDALLIGVPHLALISALIVGLSLQLSTVMALGLVIALSFLDVDVRRRPNIVLLALTQSGIAFGRFLATAVAVGLILAILDRTGLPIDLAQLLAAAAGEAKLPLLVLSVMVAIAMGLIMPSFAAYLIAAALITPALRTVGIASPTAHLLILIVSAVAVAIGYGTRSKGRLTRP
ncbi:MAG: TRAP transporter large permease subunit [Geminicoccaceae bacterium]